MVDTCDEALRVADAIPGWLRPEEARRLYHVGLAAEHDVLEIGTYHGKSTYLIAQGIRDGGRPRLVTVDMHIGADGLVLTPEPPAFLGRTLRAHQLHDVVVQIIGWSTAAVEMLDFSRIGAVFIDGGHDFESVRTDIAAVRPRLLRDTLVLFHDYHDEFPGVRQAVDQFVRTDPGFTFVELIHSLFVCRLAAATRAPGASEEVSGLRDQLESESEARRRWQREAEDLRHSTSWRITSPARWTMDRLRGRR